MGVECLWFCAASAVQGARCSQDIYAAGPPRTPSSNLNVLRKSMEYNPFERDPAARPVIEACRHIRDRRPGTFVIERAGQASIFIYWSMDSLLILTETEISSGCWNRYTTEHLVWLA